MLLLAALSGCEADRFCGYGPDQWQGFTAANESRWATAIVIDEGRFIYVVVLDGNLFEVRADEIALIKPTAVMMEGKVIHGALSLGSE